MAGWKVNRTEAMTMSGSSTPWPSQKAILLGWLRANHFLDNPFAEWEASREDRLTEYFVAGRYFDVIADQGTSPRTAFIFAPRGGGKSANRLMLESSCRPKDLTSNAISISVTDFTPLILQLKGEPSTLTTDNVVDHILRQGMASLFHMLCLKPALFDRFYPDEREAFIEFLRTYGLHLLSPRQIERHLRRSGEEISARAVAQLTRLVIDNSLSRQSKAEISSTVLELGLFLQKCLHYEFVENHLFEEETHAIQRMDEFFGVARAFEVDTVYVLIDGLDEFRETDQDRETAFRLIEPLVTQLHLLELPNLAFKFFLPLGLESLVQSSIRDDRLASFVITWSTSELTLLLEERVKAFNTQGYTGVAPLCELGFHLEIDHELVVEAGNSPRNLMRLGALLLSEHCKVPVAAHSKITKDEWEEVLSKFRREPNRPVELDGPNDLEDSLDQVSEIEKAPRLYVDAEMGMVYIDGVQLEEPLSQLEFALLSFLYDNRGKICSKDEIERAVYQPLYTEGEELEINNEGYCADPQNVYQLIKRVRKRINKEVEKEHFIRNFRGRGYQLQNTD
jgi:hypothetical protein